MKGYVEKEGKTVRHVRVDTVWQEERKEGRKGGEKTSQEFTEHPFTWSHHCLLSSTRGDLLLLSGVIPGKETANAVNRNPSTRGALGESAAWGLEGTRPGEGASPAVMGEDAISPWAAGRRVCRETSGPLEAGGRLHSDEDGRSGRKPAWAQARELSMENGHPESRVPLPDREDFPRHSLCKE